MAEGWLVPVEGRRVACPEHGGRVEIRRGRRLGTEAGEAVRRPDVRPGPAHGDATRRGRGVAENINDFSVNSFNIQRTISLGNFDLVTALPLKPTRYE